MTTKIILPALLASYLASAAVLRNGTTESSISTVTVYAYAHSTHTVFAYENCITTHEEVAVGSVTASLGYNPINDLPVAPLESISQKPRPSLASSAISERLTRSMVPHNSSLGHSHGTVVVTSSTPESAQTSTEPPSTPPGVTIVPVTPSTSSEKTTSTTSSRKAVGVPPTEPETTSTPVSGNIYPYSSGSGKPESASVSTKHNGDGCAYPTPGCDT